MKNVPQKGHLLDALSVLKYLMSKRMVKNVDIDEAFENNVELSEQLLDNMLYVIDQNIHHSSALTTFKCGKCDEFFITVEDLKTHQIQHSSQLLQKSYFFLTRHMHDGNPEIEAT